jgi:hypothetical protein
MFTIIGGFFLVADEHRAHLIPYLPGLLLLACPLLRIFMHRGHGHQRYGQVEMPAGQRSAAPTIGDSPAANTDARSGAPQCPTRAGAGRERDLRLRPMVARPRQLAPLRHLRVQLCAAAVSARLAIVRRFLGLCRRAFR